MSADLNLPVTQVPEVEYSEQEEMAWEYYGRYRSMRKVAAEMAKDGHPVAVSTVGHWIKKRTDRENAMRDVMHLFDRAQQQLLAGHALNIMFSDCQVAVKVDGTRLEKLGPLMLNIIRTQIELLGLAAPTRVSIEDERRHTVTYNYEEIKRFAELEAANDAKFDTIKGRNQK